MVQVYIIGGDGTQKGATAIYEVLHFLLSLYNITNNLLTSVATLKVEIQLALVASLPCLAYFLNQVAETCIIDSEE